MIPDHLDYNLKIIFVGYNPGEKSDLIKHHYAGRGNQFYKLLYDSGLTPRLYLPEEDSLLLKLGYGLTNIVARASKSSSDLTRKEMLEGAEILKEKIVKYRPKLLCLLGKDVYRNYANLKANTPIIYGPVKEPVFKDVREFVGPNPSGRNVIPYAEKLGHFSVLRNALLDITMEKGLK